MVNLVSSDIFFLLVLATVVVARLLLFFKPISSPTVWGLRLRHWMYGVVGILLGLTIQCLPIYAIGFGLWIDELSYIIIGGRTHRDNYSAASIGGTIILIFLTFAFRAELAVTVQA